MKKTPVILPVSIAQEFEGAELGDRRLQRRLTAIVTRVASAPSESFPKVLVTEAEREALYRFLQNESVAWEAILGPHIDATVTRCEQRPLVRIAHDTSVFSFEGDREGLGPLFQKKQGFFVHLALAISDGEERAPLGVVGLIPFVRHARRGRSQQQRVVETRAASRDDKESSRWSALTSHCNDMLRERVEYVHVMDREADDYALFAELVAAKCRFVVRGDARRKLTGDDGLVQDQLDKSTAEALRTVPLGARSKPTPNYKARGERMAKLMVRGAAITLRKPQYAQSPTKTLPLNVVQVFEPNPPDNEEPISWTLYTTEPIETSEDLIAVVDHYRARWRIEEYFKALKTGCSFEKRQITTYDGLLRSLAIFAPIAWRLLALRVVGRLDEPPSADILFDEIQMQLLRTLAKNYKIPARPTVRDAMLAIADIGGHIRANGDPGWIVLGRGFEDFVKAEQVWRAALKHKAGKM